MDSFGTPQPPVGSGPGTPPGAGGASPDEKLPQEPGIFGRVRASGYQPTQEEAQQAFQAHLLAAGFAFVSCGLFGPLGAVVGLLLAKERRPFLLFHVNQALVAQLALTVAGFALGIVQVVLTVLSAGCLGWLLIPFSLVLWGAMIVLPIVVGLGAKEGEWKLYPLLGDKVLNEWKPLLT